MFFHSTMPRLIIQRKNRISRRLLGCFALQQTAQAQAPDENTALETVIVTASAPQTRHSHCPLPGQHSMIRPSNVSRHSTAIRSSIGSREPGSAAAMVRNPDLPALSRADRRRQLRAFMTHKMASA